MSISSTLCILSLEASHTVIRYAFQATFQDLAEHGEVDAVIVSTEEGFSPLGGERGFFEHDLGISYDDEIYPLANWNRFENEAVSLMALETRNPEGLLRGLLLAPGENCLSYRPFSSISHLYRPKPHRDYYYNVSYEAIAFLCKAWGARKIVISHLSNCGHFHEDMATCHIEALVHFCKEYPDLAPESFTFCGCCINESHFKGIKGVIDESKSTVHRPINTIIDHHGKGITCITLDWKM